MKLYLLPLLLLALPMTSEGFSDPERQDRGKVAKTIVDSLWSGDFDKAAPYLVPRDWERSVSRDVMRKVFREHLAAKLSKFRRIQDKRNIYNDFPKERAGAAAMFVRRPDGYDARFQLEVLEENGVLGISMSGLLSKVWTMEYMPSNIGPNQIMSSMQVQEAIVHGLHKDSKELERLGLKGLVLKWGTFATWQELLPIYEQQLAYHRWFYDRDKLGIPPKTPMPIYPLLPGQPPRD